MLLEYLASHLSKPTNNLLREGAKRGATMAYRHLRQRISPIRFVQGYNTFIGLEAYRDLPGQQSIYFGREEYYDRLLAPIDENFHWKNPQEKIISVTGPSGAGKSSLLHMVLKHTLKERQQPPQMVETYAGCYETWQPRHGHTVLIFDQFERFVLDTQPEDRLRFVDDLKRLMIEEPVIVYLVIRSDLLASLHQPFFEQFQTVHRLVDINPFGKDNTESVFQGILAARVDLSRLSDTDQVTQREQIRHLAKIITADLHYGRERVLPVEVQIILHQLYQHTLYSEDAYHRYGRKDGLLFHYVQDELSTISPQLGLTVDMGLRVLRTMIETDLTSLKCSPKATEEILWILKETLPEKQQPEDGTIHGLLQALSERRIL